MKHYLFTIGISMGLIFSSCEREIEFKGDKTEPLLVLNSIVTSGSPINVHLSQSRFFLSSEEGFKNIGNAKVELWKDGNLIETLPGDGGGFYTSNYRPGIGDRLELKASSTGLAPVKCSTEILPEPAVLSVDTVNTRFELDFYSEPGYIGYESAIPGESGSYYSYSLTENYDLTVQIKDPKGEANYYCIQLVMRHYSSDGTTYSDQALPFESNDIVLGSGQTDLFGEKENRYNLFPDELFEGKEYRLKLSFSNSSYGGGIATNAPKQTDKRELLVNIQSLDEAYYMYLKSRLAAESDMESISEPVQIYSNITGGIGILGSYTTTTRVISLRRQ